MNKGTTCTNFFAGDGKIFFMLPDLPEPRLVVCSKPLSGEFPKVGQCAYVKGEHFQKVRLLRCTDEDSPHFATDTKTYLGIDVPDDVPIADLDMASAYVLPPNKFVMGTPMFDIFQQC